DATILHLEAEAGVVLRPNSNHDAAAVRREFQGVREIVVEHLFQLRRIDHDLFDSGIELAGQLNVLFSGQRPEDVPYFAHQLSDTDRLRPEFHFSRLDLREVEHVVDQLEQVAGAVQDVAEV